MTAHEILVDLIVSREKYLKLKARNLRLHGRRESDRIKQSALASELLEAERQMLRAEQIAAVYVAASEV